MWNSLRRLVPVVALLVAPASALSVDVVSLPQGTGGAGLAVAADGAVWFSAQFSGALGRVSPAGGISFFRFPSQGAQPLSVAVQPDGTAWAADLSGDRLGRVAPDGTFTEIVLAKAGGEPTGLAVSAEGVAWFTLPAEGRIGQRGRHDRRVLLAEVRCAQRRLAQEALSSITGDFTPDDLLGEIFSKFCIGK